MGSSWFSSPRCKAIPLAALLLSAALAAPGEAAAPKAVNPFDQLSGDWKGGGTVTPADGAPKKVDCKATYKVAGSNLSQNLLCTGHDYSINASLKLINMEGKIKGSWSESTYDANGAVTGTAKDNIIHARITGDKFSGRQVVSSFTHEHQRLWRPPLHQHAPIKPESGTYRLAASLSMGR